MLAYPRVDHTEREFLDVSDPSVIGYTGEGVW